MEHPREQILGLYAIARELVRDEHRTHIEACAECAAELGRIDAFEAALREADAWDAAEPDEASRSRRESLALLAATVAREDADARTLLEPFEDPEAAARFVWENIAARPAFHHGGVVRRLCRLANRMCERRPLYALTLAEAATRIAALLPDDLYPGAAVHDLRGEAWKEQANAFRFLGRFTEAHAALDAAEAEYARLSHAGVGIVAVTYVRAYVLYEQEQMEKASDLARRSARAAEHLGDAERATRARHLEGQILYERGSYADAAAVFAEVLAAGKAADDSRWIAWASLNLGICAIELSRIDEANRHLHHAVRLFDEMSMATELARTQWAISRLLFADRRPIEAAGRLRGVVNELTRLSMLTDAATAAVDLAEMLCAMGRAREVPGLLTGVVRTFTDNGKITSALTALAYLRSAVASGTVETNAFPYVRRFLAKADRQPGLVFVAPPRPIDPPA